MIYKYLYILFLILILNSCVSKKDKFISKLDTTVEYVSQNQQSFTSEMLEVYNSKIIELRENQFSIYRSKMTIEEINKVNLLFGRYDALVIQIELGEFINDLKDDFDQGVNDLKDGLDQGVNMVNELLAE